MTENNKEGAAYIEMAEREFLKDLRESGGISLPEAISKYDAQSKGTFFGLGKDVMDILRRNIALGTIKYDKKNNKFIAVPL